MWRVDEDQLIVAGGEVDMHFQNFYFVPGIFIQADFTDSQDVGTIQKFRDDGDNILGEFYIFGFLGIDAEPREMWEPEFRGAFGLMLGQLTEIVAEAIDGAAVEPGPESRFTYGLAAGRDHLNVVVGDAADHV